MVMPIEKARAATRATQVASKHLAERKAAWIADEMKSWKASLEVDIDAHIEEAASVGRLSTEVAVLRKSFHHREFEAITNEIDSINPPAWMDEVLSAYRRAGYRYKLYMAPEENKTSLCVQISW